MLRELDIENLAVIEKATISFCDNLNVFTGETGAGKSILIGGINAVLGGRVGRDIVRTGKNKAIITALFDDIPENVAETLKENGYSYDGELLLQREIASDGKSSARINGKITTASILREIASRLIDIHGQHDTAILMSTDNQRQILDTYGGIEEKLKEYKDVFRDFSHVSKEVKLLQQRIEEKESRIHELSEKIKDVDSYDLKPDEDIDVAAQLEAARSFEEVQDALSSAYMNISGFDDGEGALSLLRAALGELDKISEKVNGVGELSQRLSGILIDLEDIGNEVSKNLNDDYSPENITLLENRKSDLLLLKRRYKMEINELIDTLAQWKTELEELKSGDDALERLNERRRELADEVKKRASEISELRKKAADKLVDAVTNELIFLDMPNVRFVFDFQRDKITNTGMDKVEMLISVNKGEDPKSMNKIASGGELSRIMLAIKNVLASADKIPTMIFDEIDTGISGRAAQKVGIKLYETARKRQVLCVTHLAQIAAMGDRHLLIEKQSDDNRTYTNVHTLDFEGRKSEIARIISGESNNETTLKIAEELLKREK